jgi:methionyl aminopeptidase
MSITIKNESQLVSMRIACKIAQQCHFLIAQNLKAGLPASELDRLAHDYIVSQNAKPSFLNYGGFPNSICVSVNDCVLHGIPSEKLVLAENDLVSIDIGVNYQGLNADCARSYVLGDSPSRQQLNRTTRQCLSQAIEKVRPGAKVSDIAQAIHKTASAGHYGVVKEYCGHGIGRELHEDPQIPCYYPFGGTDASLVKGMVICIEPMLLEKQCGTQIREGVGIFAANGKDAAHWEDQILVTESGYEVLT